MATTQMEDLPVGDLQLDSKHSAISSASGYETPPTESTELDPSQTSSIPSSGVEATSTGTIRVPFAHPLPDCKPIVRPDLTLEQEAKYTALLKTVSEWTEIPISLAKDATQEPITDSQRMWLTRECLLRYLRATNWSATEAPKRILHTMAWRCEFKADNITADHISIESETGKQHILGYDINARPCLYMNPARQNTQKGHRQIEHLVYMLDRVIDMMDPGQETTALLIGFKNSRAGGNPSVGQGREVLSILQSHYPERLGKAMISDVPWYVNTFFKLISAFIDPVTKDKMVFNGNLREYVPPTQLDKNFGGDADFEYEHDQYWPALVHMCEQRRIAYLKRWEAGGKRIGEHEAYLRGGDQKPLMALQTPDTSVVA